MEAIKIQSEQLKKVLLRITDKLDDLYNGNIELHNDYYIHVGSKSYFDMSTEPAITAGSLIDDWKSLELLLSDKERPCTFVDFERMASILRAISEEYNAIQ